VMPGVRLLGRYSPFLLECAAAAGCRRCKVEAWAAMVDGLTSKQVGSAGHGAGRMSSLTRRAMKDGLKMSRNINILLIEGAAAADGAAAW
jgi:hypothetical protein